MNDKLRVQFIHGLEATIKGQKAQYLRTKFTNTAILQMDTSSPNDCLKQQIECLKTFQPDVIVGSSFGGALALELMALGFWKGPVVLLAPAITFFRNYISKSTFYSLSVDLPLDLPSAPPPLSQSSSSPTPLTPSGGKVVVPSLSQEETLNTLKETKESSILIVHGSNDELIPIDDSRKLKILLQQVKKSENLNESERVVLEEIEDVHHLPKIVNENLLEKYIYRVYEIHHNKCVPSAL
eukprot:TRINITY_DN4847_c0_g1_i1.p1 TRINITY_DN4847_c0_g1~~TRINITY_DN4847_c0_g1_i1.p1  ORF type:complete len:248 (+),score=70.84 TRINITY_DN4847_c0_g1_i1:30-746(+)